MLLSMAFMRAHAQEDGDGWEGDRTITAIYYLFKNIAPDLTGFKFDIYSHVRKHKRFDEGHIIINYDTSLYGDSLIARGKLTVDLSTNLDSNIYTLTARDLGPGKLKIVIASTGVAASHFRLDTIPKQILKCKIRGVTLNSLITSASIVYDSTAMQHESKYIKSNGNIIRLFDRVYVESNLRSVADSINFSIANDTLNDLSHPTYLDFDVIGSATIPDVNLGEYTTKVTFNEHTFDNATVTNIIANGCGDDGSGSGVGGILGGDSIYDFNWAYAPGSVTISLTYNYNFDPTDSDMAQVYNQIQGATPLAHVRLHISDCHYLPDVVIDPSSNATWLDTSILSFQVYNPTYIGSGYTDTICTPVPVIDNYTPQCISAGTFQMLTISGRFFGTGTGTVFFTNAESPGTYIQTYPQDILYWSDDTIELYIPSVPSTGIGGSGTFYIKTASGLDNSADSNYIDIGYANKNYRTSDGYPHFVYLLDTPYIFQLPSSMFLTAGMVQSVQNVLADLRCKTGIRFYVDTVNAAPVDTPSSNDGVNLISMQPDSASVFRGRDPNTLAVTKATYYPCNDGLSQYNSSAGYVTDIDITLKASPPPAAGFPAAGWNWWWYETNLTGTLWYDAPSALTHEFGHAAQLCHTLPQLPGAENVMYYQLPQEQVIRDYDDDPNAVFGIRHVLDLGDTLSAVGRCALHPGMIAQYSAICPRLDPAVCEGTTGINQISNGAKGFTAMLYPNPYQDNTIVHIEVNRYSNISVTMYDLLGNIIMQKNAAGSTSFDIPLSNVSLSAGMYLIQVSDGQNQTTLKLIKI